jgi:hypothetical protein
MWFSISPLIFFSERPLRAAEESTCRSWIQIERGSHFVVAEAVTAKQEQPGIPWVQHRQHPPNLILFLARRMRLFGIVGPVRESKQPLIPLVPSPLPQFVQRQPDSAAIKPAAGLLTMSSRIPPQLQKDFNRQFLRAPRIPNHPGNDAGDAFIMNAKYRLKCEIGFLDTRALNRRRSIHKTSTLSEENL